MLPSRLLNCTPHLLPGLLVLAVVGVVTAAPSYGQTEASEVNRVYQRFVEAHDALDADQIAPLYAEDARYLNANSEEGVRTGRDAILENFRSLFEKAQERWDDLPISFRVIDRKIDGRLAYDVGYYRYETVPAEGEPVRGAGKFVAVLRGRSDGQWRFVVDSAGKAPLTAFDEAETVAQIP